MDGKEMVKVIAAIFFCQLAGLIGSVFTFSAITTWYADLVKPAFAPPNWIFGPVWFTLYTLMGISAYIIYNSKNKDRPAAMTMFALQLGLNALWSFLFFGLKSPLLGLAGILTLWISIVSTIYLFYKISKPAAALLIPYIIWVSIAAALNYYIFILN
ncbi:MAG: TspO/MBR family protein [Candidatus Micrarchaeota archaeon]